LVNNRYRFAARTLLPEWARCKRFLLHPTYPGDISLDSNNEILIARCSPGNYTMAVVNRRCEMICVSIMTITFLRNRRSKMEEPTMWFSFF